MMKSGFTGRLSSICGFQKHTPAWCNSLVAVVCIIKVFQGKCTTRTPPVAAVQPRIHPPHHIYFTSLNFMPCSVCGASSIFLSPPAGQPQLRTSVFSFCNTCRFCFAGMHLQDGSKKKKPCLACYGLVPTCFAFPAPAFGWHGAGWRSGLTLLLPDTKQPHIGSAAAATEPQYPTSCSSFGHCSQYKYIERHHTF